MRCDHRALHTCSHHKETPTPTVPPKDGRLFLRCSDLTVERGPHARDQRLPPVLDTLAREHRVPDCDIGRLADTQFHPVAKDFWMTLDKAFGTEAVCECDDPGTM